MASILEQAQRSARIDLEDLAAWARIEEATLREALAGQRELTAAELDRVACVFGLRLDDLLEGKMLGLKPSDALPFENLPAALVAPVVNVEQSIVRRAQRYLGIKHPDRDLVAGNIERQGTGWRVAIVTGGVGAVLDEAAGHLVLSTSGDVLHDAVEAAR